MAPRNREIARLLREYAEVLKLAEGSAQSFRVRAYEKAVDALRGLAQEAATMSVAELKAVEGIGASTARKIREYVDTGAIASLEELRRTYPRELVELMRIPGMGPKTVVQVREQLGVEDLDGLKRALDAQQLRELPGLGARSEEKIARAIERLGLHSKERRTPILQALPVAAEMVEVLRAVPGVKHVRYCGSLRRFRETIGDVDILVASRDPQPVMETFVSQPAVAEVIGRGDTKSSILTSGGFQVDLRVVAPAEFGAATLYFTGSKNHNIALRQRAIERGLILNEYALAEAESGTVVASRTERAVYAALDLPLIPPEVREGVGEIEAAAAGTLPPLVERRHLRGDLHVHSDWSGDGRSSLDDMVDAAAARGLEYLAITEHGENLAINGLSRERVLAEREELARVGSRHPDLVILHGAELNIGPDGRLDYDDDFLMGFAWCVASVHSHFDLGEAAQTDRLLRAVRHPAVNAIGHLTGRRIGTRPGIELDVDAVFAAAAESGTAIEINAHLDRLDPSSDLLQRARRVDGLRFVIASDAHHTSEFANLEWGVKHARRGWIPRRAVANTWPRDRFLRWAAAKRRRG
jgi:DNA polymerase (family 10)